jgi:hypothetical protein
MEAIMETLTINAALIELFADKLKKLNRKAVKLGMTPVSARFGPMTEKAASKRTAGAYSRVVSGGYGSQTKWYALYVEVTIEGDAPVIEGHRFLATVDLTGTVPMVRRQPWVSDADLTTFFHTDGHCDHCNTLRLRNDVLVLEEVATGKLLQIGRNCAADFFRSKDAVQRLGVSDYVSALSFSDEGDDWGSSKHFQPSVGLVQMFTVAAAVVRVFGWASTKMVQEDDTLTSTRSRLVTNIWPSPKTPDTALVGAILPEDQTLADEVITWLDETFTNKVGGAEFDHNVRAAMEVDSDGYRYVRIKNMGYLVWAIHGYGVDREKRAAKATEMSTIAVSDYVGSVGVRAEFMLSLMFRRVIASEYGPKALCKFRDASGNLVVWWGTGDSAFNTIVGNVYTIKATVKSHGVYEGIKQTSISRATILQGEMNKAD